MTTLLYAIVGSFALGSLSTGALLLLLVELRWRDPQLKGWHRPLNILSCFRR